MPNSEYLITLLQRISDLKSEIAVIEARCATANNGGLCYASMTGALESTVKHAATEADRAIAWTTEHIVPAETEAQRLVTIFENLGLDLDEETLATLELMGKDETYRSEASGIVSAISRQVADVQFSERDYEFQNAIEALAAAGFVIDEDGETWTRNNERVTITLKNGREFRYAWDYEVNDNATHPTYKCESGISGDFKRLIDLITPAKESEAPAGAETSATEVLQ